MKYQKIVEAKKQLDELIREKEKHLLDLKYKSECIKQTIIFMEQCEVIPHEPGRGTDNGERKKPSRGMTGEILDILDINSVGEYDDITAPACAKEIHQCLTETQTYENCTINSVTGLLCLMTQDGRLGRIKQGRSFHYYINGGVK